MNYKVFLPIVFLLITACQNAPENINHDKNQNASNKAETKIYKAVGVIENVDAENAKLKINHEEIIGFMKPMTMDFDLKNKDLAQNLKIGDKVEFTLERNGADLKISEIKKIGEVSANENPETKMLAEGKNIYAENCAKCHGATGEGAKKGIPLIKGHALHHTEAEFIEQVTDGEGKKMPAFKDKLTAEQIAAVVKFVREDLQKDAVKDPKDAHKHHHH